MEKFGFMPAGYSTAQILSNSEPAMVVSEGFGTLLMQIPAGTEFASNEAGDLIVGELGDTVGQIRCISTDGNFLDVQIVEPDVDADAPSQPDTSEPAAE